MKVIGTVKYEFPDREDPTKMVKGVTVYALKPLNFEGSKGYMPEKFSFSDWFINNRLGGVIPDVDDEIMVEYNKKGKIANAYITRPTV